MFRLVHEGDTILEVEEQVTEVTLRTARGSGQPVFISPTDGVIEIVIAKVAPGGPLRLDHLEALQLKAIRDRGTEGERVGNVADTLNGPEAHMLVTPQGFNADTAGEGTNREHVDMGTLPAEDLAEGAKDEKERTARIDAFGKDGSLPSKKDEPKDTAKETPKSDGDKPKTGAGAKVSI